MVPSLHMSHHGSAGALKHHKSHWIAAAQWHTSALYLFLHRDWSVLLHNRRGRVRYGSHAALSVSLTSTWRTEMLVEYGFGVIRV